MKQDKNLSLAKLEGNQASGNTSEWEGGGEGGVVRLVLMLVLPRWRRRLSGTEFVLMT